MTHEYALALLKADLGFYTVSGPVSDLLESKLKAAEKAIAKWASRSTWKTGTILTCS